MIRRTDSNPRDAVAVAWRQLIDATVTLLTLGRYTTDFAFRHMFRSDA